MASRTLRLRQGFSPAASAGVVALLAVGVLIAVAPLPIAAGLVAGGIVLAVAAIRPELLLIPIAFAIPFGSIREFGVAGVNISATDGLVAALALGWALRMVRQRAVRIELTLVGAPLLLYLATSLYSLTTATYLSFSIKEVLKWVQFAIVLWFVATEIRSERWRWVIVGSVLAATAAQALLGWYQFLRQAGPAGFVIFGRFLRAFGTFGQPNPFSGYVNTGWLLAAALFLGSLFAGWRSIPWRYLVAFGAVAGIGGMAILMSFSRGSWIAAGAALCAMIALLDRRSWKYLAAGFLVAFLVGFLGAFNLLPATITERITTAISYFGIFDARTVILTPENYAVVERMATWQAAAEMFASNPWLGVGIGNFNAFYPDFALRGWEYQPGHAHNVYLNALSETGLIGASAFYLFFASQALLLGRAIRSARRVAATRPLWLALTVGAAGAWIAVGLHNGLDNLYVSHIPVQLAIILGLAAGIDRQVRDGAAA